LERVLRGRVTVLEPFGPGLADPSHAAAAGTKVAFQEINGSSVQTTTDAAGRYGFVVAGGHPAPRVLARALPGGQRLDRNLQVLDAAGKTLGRALVQVSLYTPSITVVDIDAGQQANAVYVEGTVVAPAARTQLRSVTVTVSLTLGQNHYSGTATSGRFGHYRIKAVRDSGSGGLGGRLVVVTLRENGKLIDTQSAGFPAASSLPSTIITAPDLHG
jgi:hypothetical protein